MAKAKKYRVLRIIVAVILVIFCCICGWGTWFTHHYKAILKERIPHIVTASTDSLYTISFDDINISYYNHRVTIANIRLQPDTMQAKLMRQQHRHIPTTLSKVTIARAEIDGIAWNDLAGNHSFDCSDMIVHKLKWDMEATPHPADSAFSRDEQKKPFITRITAAHFTVIDPDISYWYKGPSSTFKCFMKGGSAHLEHWAYNYDEKADTSVFLYAKSGVVRLDSFILLKPTGRYSVKKPLLDFNAGDNFVALKNVEIKQMTDRDPSSGAEKEVYDLHFPSIRLTGFNWNNLINNSTLVVAHITAAKPGIAIKFYRAAETNDNKRGSYPHQLLLQVALHTYIHHLGIENGQIKYTEVTKKGDEGVVEFTNIKGDFTNITNIDSAIAVHKNCEIKLAGKYMDKSPLDARFNLDLSNKSGHFTMDGSLKELDGNEVLQQTRALTIAEVTSFHLSDMDFHEEGDESYVKGDFTIKYEDLKISLLKFKSDQRKGKKGPLSFLGSTLLLYPSNPMPNKDIRKVSTTFARETSKGFISMIWKNMYYAAKKTAMRNDKLLVLTDGKETTKGEQPAPKGFFKRLFGKNKHKDD